MANSNFTPPNLLSAADDLSLRTLRVICAVAQGGGVSRASVLLGLAQSAVSRHLAQAERSLGCRLFHRTGRGTQPTSQGDVMLPMIRALLLQADGLALTARDMAQVPTGVVTIGLVPSLAGPLASAVHLAVRKQFPQIRLRVAEGYSGEMETALSEGRVDMAVLNRYGPSGQSSYRQLLSVQLCLVARAKIFRRALGLTDTETLPGKVSTATLARMPLVLPIAPNAIRKLLDDVSLRQNLSLDVLLEAGSSVVIRQMLADHDCASVLPRHAVMAELAAGTFIALPLADKLFLQHVVLATSTQRPFSLASRSVAQVIPQAVSSLRLTAC
jgi:LysR family transcriptional regulator, nitrogen assimilation regulatory protein